MNLARLFAVVRKETLQLRRDRLTFAMMFAMPIVQLFLFGYAINNDPKGLPTAILADAPSSLSRALVAGLQTTGYFRIVALPQSESEAAALLQQGEAQFIVTVPGDLLRRVARNEPAQISLVADAADPAAVGNAVNAAQEAVRRVVDRELQGVLGAHRTAPAPVELIVHRAYNPENLTRYNIVPGLLGVVLTMTMVVMTALSVTRERERGTMENLLAMPVRPIEVMAGKIVPNVAIGAVQVAVILTAARLIFDVPMLGSLVWLSLACLLFITVNLAIGFTFSTIAQNQLQAMQMSFFFMMPSILLSGFMFPFRGMPLWAQVIGEALPTTHFIRIVRALMLKGAGLSDILFELAALGALLVLTVAVALKRYRNTLD